MSAKVVFASGISSHALHEAGNVNQVDPIFGKLLPCLHGSDGAELLVAEERNPDLMPFTRLIDLRSADGDDEARLLEMGSSIL